MQSHVNKTIVSLRPVYTAGGVLYDSIVAVQLLYNNIE